MKRRILALLLILVMVLAGCQKAEHPHVQPQETPAAQTQDAAERPAETQNGNDGEEESRPSEAKEDAAALPEHLGPENDRVHQDVFADGEAVGLLPGKDPADRQALAVLHDRVPVLVLLVVDEIADEKIQRGFRSL
jgi:hypothetical protein